MIRVRGLERSIDQVDHDVAQSLMLARTGDTIDSPFAQFASQTVERSGSWGMPGSAAPAGLDQPVGPADVADAEAPAQNKEEEEK